MNHYAMTLQFDKGASYQLGMQSIVGQAHVLSLPKVITERNYNVRMDVQYKYLYIWIISERSSSLVWDLDYH